MTTLNEIAKITGKSVSTVSRALKNDRRISQKTIDQIQAVACQKGYTKKPFHDFGDNQTFKTIALIVPEVISSYYTRIIQLAQQNLYAHDYSLTVRVSNFNTALTLRHLKELSSYNISGLILVLDNAEEISSDVINALKYIHYPIMLITTHYISNLDFDNIYLDEMRAVSMAIDYLAKCGYHRIGFLGEKKTLGRLKYFRNAMEQQHLSVNEDDILISPIRAEQGGYECIKELNLRNKSMPDALFASYDQMAIGAIKALTELNYSIPEDVAIIGFDDLPISKYIYKGITTIQNPCEDMISIACRILLNRIKGDRSVPQQIALKPQIIARGTT